MVFMHWPLAHNPGRILHSSISSPSEPKPDSRQRSSKSNVPSAGHISQSYSETPQPSPIVQQQSDLVTYKIQLKRYFFSLRSQLFKYLLIIDSRFIFITSIFSDVVESPPSIPSPLPAPSKTSNCLKVRNRIADDIFLIMMLIKTSFISLYNYHIVASITCKVLQLLYWSIFPAFGQCNLLCPQNFHSHRCNRIYNHLKRG